MTSALRWKRAWVGVAAVVVMSAVGAGGQQPPSSEGEAPSWPPAARPIELMARRGAEWLAVMNRPEGVFNIGFNPALNSPAEEDHYLLQVKAAWALARSAQVFRSAPHNAKAKQALLVLLAQTRLDPSQPGVRLTQMPAAGVNRAAAAAWLVLAIHALPDATPDLLTQAEQLTAYFRTVQQDNGLFRMDQDGFPLALGRTTARQELTRTQGVIIQALIASHAQAPAPWKLESARRAIHACRSTFQGNRQMEITYGVIAGASEAYLRTKEPFFAEVALEMSDWLTTLQYPSDPRAVHLQGGFMQWQDGQSVRTPPTLCSAAAIAALADACRVARQAGQVQAFDRARQALDRGMVFLASLQYTSANTAHFAEPFRAQVVGAFRAGSDDGRILFAEHAEAVEACLRYLEASIPPR